MLRQGTLPPLTILPGPLQGRLQPYYAHLAQRAGMRHDRSLAEVEAALGPLYTSDPVLAGEILLGRAELDLNLEQAVVEAHRAAQNRVYEPGFDTPEGIGQAAHVYIGAEHLPEAERDALRDTIDAALADAGKRPEFQAALATAWQADLETHVQQLSLAYTDAWEREGDSSAVIELAQIAASVSVRELRHDANRLIQESGIRTAYDTIETRFQDDALAALPEPLQQPMREAIIGELGRIHTLDMLANEEVASFEGDAAADAKLLAEQQDNLLPLLSASIQRRGIEQTLLDTAAAIQQADGAQREALRAALQEALETLPGDIAFKQAERKFGTLDHIRALVAAQGQVRVRYGDEAPITQIIEAFVFKEQSAVKGNAAGLDLRVAPIVDYGEIEPYPDIPADQLWRYVTDDALQREGISPGLRNLDPETFEFLLNLNAVIDYADAEFRQRVADTLNTEVHTLYDTNAAAHADTVAAALAGKSAAAQHELLEAELFPRRVTGELNFSSVVALSPRVSNSKAAAIDYVLASRDPAVQRERIQQVLTTSSGVADLRSQASSAEGLASRKAFEEAGVRDSPRVTRPPGTAIPFVESAVKRTVDYGIKRGVLDNEVMLDTQWAARGVLGWTDADKAGDPARQIDPESWSAAFALRIGEKELGKFSQLQMTTSLSYVNRGKTLGDQPTRAEQALQALITTHKVGAPPSTLGEMGADLISVHPNLHEVRSRHIDELAPYIGLPMGPNDDHFELDTGDWQYRIRNDETGAIVGARVRERDDGPSTDMIVSGVLTILSYVPYVQVVAIPANYAYQAARAVETDDLLRGVTSAVGFANWGANVVANSATASSTAVSTAKDIAGVTSNTLTAIQTGNAVYTAIQSGDPWAIASATFSAAGAYTDGMLSVNLNTASATVDIARAVKDGQLELGLYGLSNLAGARSQHAATLDPKANTYTLDTTSDAFRLAGDLVSENYVGAIDNFGSIITRDNQVHIDLNIDSDQFPTFGEYTIPSLDPLETGDELTTTDGVDLETDSSWEAEITRPDASGENVTTDESVGTGSADDTANPMSDPFWQPEITRPDASPEDFNNSAVGVGDIAATTPLAVAAGRQIALQEMLGNGYRIGQQGVITLGRGSSLAAQTGSRLLPALGSIPASIPVVLVSTLLPDNLFEGRTEFGLGDNLRATARPEERLVSFERRDVDGEWHDTGIVSAALFNDQFEPIGFEGLSPEEIDLLTRPTGYPAESPINDEIGGFASDDDNLRFPVVTPFPAVLNEPEIYIHPIPEDVDMGPVMDSRNTDLPHALRPDSTRYRGILELQPGDNLQGHHVITADVVNAYPDFFIDLARNGWVLDSASNLAALPTTEDKQNEILQATGSLVPIHRGSHPFWDLGVEERLAPIVKEYERTQDVDRAIRRTEELQADLIQSLIIESPGSSDSSHSGERLE